MPSIAPQPEIAALQEENARLRGDLLTLSRRISHDLRTPLSAIGIASTALAETLAERNSPTPPAATPPHSPAAALPQSIFESVDEISALIERISFVVKASAEPAAPQLFRMEQAVWAALQRLERRLLKKGMSVRQPSSWPAVTGVEPWIEIVWANLIANALQHGGPAPRIEIGWGREKDEYIFWVDDEGPGVAGQQVAMLFEPFERMHRINAPRGLGLAIVQRLVSLQGGRCGHIPRPAGGSRFFFALPA